MQAVEKKCSNSFSFGYQQPGRNQSNGSRWQFNGMESDPEIKGEGNSLDFGARIYDPRAVKFYSLDHFASNYPYHSPYQYAANSPIYFTDDNGDGPIHPLTQKEDPTITYLNYRDVFVVTLGSNYLALPTDAPIIDQDLFDIGQTILRDIKASQWVIDEDEQEDAGNTRGVVNLNEEYYGKEIFSSEDAPKVGDWVRSATVQTPRTRARNFISASQAGTYLIAVVDEEHDLILKTVENNIITREEFFDLNDNGTYELVRDVTYDVVEKEFERTVQRGNTNITYKFAETVVIENTFDAKKNESIINGFTVKFELKSVEVEEATKLPNDRAKTN